MNISKRIASIAVVAVLSVAGLAAVTMVGGHDGRWGHSAFASPDRGKDGGKSMCHRGGKGGKHGKHSRHGRHKGPDYLAKKLSIMETEIGIRANQIDAWRDFTDALQATMKRPDRAGMMAAGGDNPEPFALAEGLANKVINRAESAEDLKKAIDELRTTLTPEQLQKVKEIEKRVREKMAHRWGKGPHGKPHCGKGKHGKGPHDMSRPDKAPDASPKPADDDDDDDG